MKKSKAKKAVNYDALSDILYFGVEKGKEEEYTEVAPGINAELNRDGRIIGIEVMNASKVFSPAARAIDSKVGSREFQAA